MEKTQFRELKSSLSSTLLALPKAKGSNTLANSGPKSTIFPRKRFTEVGRRNNSSTKMVDNSSSRKEYRQKTLVQQNHLQVRPPSVSASCWVIYDDNKNKHIGSREHLQKQVASLTKIMTCLVVIQMMEKYHMDKNLFIRVSKAATSLNGTSSNLKTGYYIQLIDLLHGLMLPSGNDAAYLLAQSFGLLMLYQRLRPAQKQYCDIETIDISTYDCTDHFVSHFIKQMNKKAKQIGMYQTSFVNPHGLANALNYSTAKDMLSLSTYSFSHKLFMDISSTESYIAFLYENIENEGKQIELRWRNTNRLLSEGWQGIKTGQTNNAGACLSSVKNGVFIVVLNSLNCDKRFDDTVALYDWYCSQYRWK